MVYLRRFTFLFLFVLWALLTQSSDGFASSPSFASSQKKQNKIFEEAVAAYRNGDLDKSEKLIGKLIKSDSLNVRAFLLLSDISAERNDNSMQIEVLKKVVSIDSVNYPEAFKMLGNLYYNMADYDRAVSNYNKYLLNAVPKDSLFISERIKSCNFCRESILLNRDVKIIRLDSSINTPKNEYWPSISTNDSLLYFTRLIDDEQPFSFERIFISRIDNGNWGMAEQLNFSGDVETNVGTMCISADEKLMFFTICGQKGGYGSCDIFYSIKQNGEWQKPHNAGSVLNGRSWDAQPSVSSDCRFVYFSSNRDGGFGGMDIWRSEFKQMKDGTLFFQEAENLGSGINSSKNDFSPFIHADGTTLYFASEGKYGFGGSDLFLSRLKDSVWSSAVNPGYPLNTRYNEDGLVISPTGNTAVFSSDRDRSATISKDLFQFVLPDDFAPERVGYIKGYVFNKETKARLNATIEIAQLENNDRKDVYSDKADGYITTLVANRIYAMNVSLEGYLFYSQNFNLKDLASFNQAQQVDIYLEPVNPGDKIVLSNIFFDFDSSALKPESYPELNQLIEFLNRNPRLKIEISGHTDNVGKEAYNQELSENRAKSICNYLMQNINQDRLSFKGYGSTVPVATNDTEEGRSLNRRCEMKIISD